MLQGKALDLKELIRPYYLKWIYFPVSDNHCPPEFKRWRQYPSVPLELAKQIVSSASDGLPDALFLPMTDWHGIRQRSQQMARGFSGLGHRCFYLNPHLGREFPQVYPLSQKRLLTSLEPRIAELHVHLLREPVFHHRRLNREEVETVTAGILAMLQATESSRQLSIVGLPVWTDVALRLREALHTPIVYDCHDLLEGFDGIGQDVLDQEGELFASADLVVFSAEWLAHEHISRRPELAGKAVVIRNGADSQHFAGVVRNSSGGPVTVGYIGALNSWFDIQAIRAAASEHPDWRFLLVGPTGSGFPKNAFAGLKNIQLIGEVGYQDLPAWMARFDVATIPFLIQPLTMATNPVKLYEYFACGLPVVSSPLAEVARYSDLVYLAGDPAEFVRQLERAVQENDPSKRDARRTVAIRENWRSRSETLIAELAKITGA